jgi:uncharacterized membrane protein SirB2
MLEFYPQIKLVHIVCALLSGCLFFARGIGVLRAAHWPMALPVRMTSYAIDTALLTAALMLVSILPAAVFANGWLTMKLVLLATYIVLGSFALKRASSRRARALCFVAASLCFLCITAIARSHEPLGPSRIMIG